MNGGVAHVEADLVAATHDEAHEDCWPETSRWAKRDERIMRCQKDSIFKKKGMLHSAHFAYAPLHISISYSKSG